MKETQNQQILNHLLGGNVLTQIDAFEKFGCFRLASRVHDLRSDGHNIVTKNVKSLNKSYASYYIPRQLEYWETMP